MSFISNWLRPQQFQQQDPQSGNHSGLSSHELQEAISKNDPERTRHSLDTMPDTLINHPLPNGELPLHLAIRQQSQEIIKLLFTHPRIDLNKKDDQGLTPFDHLFLIQNKKLTHFVLSLLCNKTLDDAQLFLGPYSSNQIKMIEKDIRQRADDASELEPLHQAAQRGDIKALKRYVQVGKDLNKQTATGQTALYYAVKEGHEAAVRWLINHGARTDLTTNQRVSVLHVAALQNNHSMVNVLIESGMSPNSCDDMDYTPLHYATLNRNVLMAQFLIKKGANPLVDSARISPITFMIHMAQHQAQEKDPLKLDWLPILMCMCSLTTWVQSYYNPHHWTTSALQSTSSYMLSGMVISQLIKTQVSLRQLLKAEMTSVQIAQTLIAPVADLILAFPWLDQTPILSEVSLAFRTYCISRSVWQDAATGWRNLKPNRRSMGYFFVRSVNAVSSVWNIYARAKTIWINARLNKEVYSSLAQQDCQGALKAASTMYRYPFKEAALFRVTEQCAATSPNVAEQAMSLMADVSYQKAGLKKIAENKLSEGKCKEAFDMATRIPSCDQLAAYTTIAINPTCKKQDPLTVNAAVAKITKLSHDDTTLQQLVDIHLTLGNCKQALLPASKITFSDNKSKALLAIVNDLNCLQKQPDVAIEAALTLPFWHEKDTALNKLVYVFLKQEHCQKALETAFEINFSYEKNEALLAIVADPVCLQKQPDLTLQAALKIGYNKDKVLNDLVNTYLKAGHCQHAQQAANHMNPGYNQKKAFEAITITATCLGDDQSKIDQTKTPTSSKSLTALGKTSLILIICLIFKRVIK